MLVIKTVRIRVIVKAIADSVEKEKVKKISERNVLCLKSYKIFNDCIITLVHEHFSSCTQKNRPTRGSSIDSVSKKRRNDSNITIFATSEQEIVSLLTEFYRAVKFKPILP